MSIPPVPYPAMEGEAVATRAGVDMVGVVLWQFARFTNLDV